MLGRTRRIAVMAEGCFTQMDAKTALGVIRYRPDEVVAVIDSVRAGRTAADCVGVGGSIPVVASLEDAARHAPDTLLVGIAPQGGHLPESWRHIVRAALTRGWDVVSGLHVFLSDDPELAALATAHGCAIHDVRRPPVGRPIAARRVLASDALVVLTVGTDCNVGKMTTALELHAELRSRGVRAAFVATGQTGILVADQGAAVDAVTADFVAGVVERMVLDAARDADVVLVEGQGAIHHPAYSGVTLGLMHGACPEALILCHQAGRTHMKLGDAAPAPRLRPLGQIVRDNERAAGWVRPASVLALSLNTMLLDEAEARRAIDSAQQFTGLPTVDPVRFGAESVATEILRRLDERKRGGPAEG
ncbi:MAG: hypothetical protein RL721_686 [Candidatus Eisenbacteria bacterium]|jgi:uncharacterized NAD-dependent epimerase/dehydratase family protein